MLWYLINSVQEKFVESLLKCYGMIQSIILALEYSGQIPSGGRQLKTKHVLKNKNKNKKPSVVSTIGEAQTKCQRGKKISLL